MNHREYLKKLGISPLKRFSQNFLVDQNIIEKLLKVADIHRGDSVLEIGPGCGAITKSLLEKGAEVTAIEIDRTLSRELRKLPITLIEGDVLKVELPQADKVVANLPFHIASPIIAKLLPNYEQSTLICQEEMARRLVAKPGCKEYGSFTVFAAFYSDVKYAFKISKSCFYPAPKVDSAVVHFTKKESPKVDPEQFFAFVHTAFQARRKKVATTWKKKYGLHVETDARPENLSIEEFLCYFNLL